MDLELLRQKVHSRILAHDVRDQVKNIIGQQVTSTDKVIQTLKAQGIIENLLNEINYKTETHTDLHKNLSNLNIFEKIENDVARNASSSVSLGMEIGNSDRIISVVITSGKTFVDASPEKNYEITVVFTNNQRSKSLKFPASVEPEINLVSFFDLSHWGGIFCDGGKNRGIDV